MSAIGMTHLIRNTFTIHWCVGSYKHRRFSRLEFCQREPFALHRFIRSSLAPRNGLERCSRRFINSTSKIYDRISESQWLPWPKPTRTLNGRVLGQVVNNHALCSFISTVEPNTLLVISRSANSTREFCFKVCSHYNLKPLPP